MTRDDDGATARGAEGNNPDGGRLRGRFTPAPMRGNGTRENGLLLKGRDEHAEPAKGEASRVAPAERPLSRPEDG